MTTFYGQQHRSLQDQFDSCEIADVLAAVIARPDIDDEAKAVIESRSLARIALGWTDRNAIVNPRGGECLYELVPARIVTVRCGLMTVWPWQCSRHRGAPRRRLVV
jgi:hypothetical protein